jgi:glycosyltransferase involved in cell wall biosynthesis
LRPRPIRDAAHDARCLRSPSRDLRLVDPLNIEAAAVIKVAYDHQTFSMQAYGGISRYVCELAQRIPRQAGFETCVVAPVHFNSHLAQSPSKTFGVYVPMRIPWSGRLYRLTNRVVAAPMMRAYSPDIVHRTYYAVTPAPPGAALAVTVHDMIHELFPNYFARNDPTTQLKRASVQAADLILCNSQSTANDLMRLFGVSDQKIHVTHLGVSDFLSGRNVAPLSAPGQRPYLLYVGHRGGYKNFEGALRAYARLPRLQEAFDWVVFGGVPLSDAEQSLFAELKLRPDAVHRLVGDDEALARAYTGAHAFIYPSMYEGFGIPPLEAMAHGCPVASAGVSSMPEVVGDAAQSFDPHDVESMLQALETICFDEQRRQWLIAQGRQRIGLFSWDRCAAETAAAYRAALGSSVQRESAAAT